MIHMKCQTLFSLKNKQNTLSFGHLNSLPYLFYNFNKYNLLPDVVSIKCWTSDKQSRPWWATIFYSISSGSTLFAHTSPTKIHTVNMVSVCVYWACYFGPPSVHTWHVLKRTTEPGQSISYKTAPSEDSDQPGHPDWLIQVLVVLLKILWILDYPQKALQRLWSDSMAAAADPSLCWAHMQCCRKCCAQAQLLS